jgi:hypothetical protein
VSVLAGEREECANVLLPVLAGVAARDRDPALLGIEKTQEQVDDSGRAGSAGADEGDPPSGIQAQLEAAQRRLLAGGVARSHTLQGDDIRAGRSRCGVGRIVNLDLSVGQLEHTAAGRQRAEELPHDRQRATARVGSARRASVATSTGRGRVSWAATATARTPATVAPHQDRERQRAPRRVRHAGRAGRAHDRLCAPGAVSPPRARTPRARARREAPQRGQL